MQTRSSSRLVSDQSSNPTSSTNPNPKGRNRRRSKQRTVNSNLEEHSPTVVKMADQHTMAQLLQAPTEGYEDAIVVPAITDDNFELTHERSSCGTWYTRDCCCSKGNVEDKILVPKPPKNYARCARCGHPVDGLYCQGCTFLRKKIKEDLVTHFQGFQNTFESSDDSTNVVNTPQKPFVVKQDHGSFVNKIICDLNKAPDSPHLHTFLPNQFHCFHCKDVLGDGEACQRCTCKRFESGLSKGLCYICGNNQNSLNDSPSISANSSHDPP
nr:hypothetical protein [Tanacetum cinerariifolium]GEY41778.1 hypothetical protein [Tanacetum cinerariifolium]